jgi:hypothetical protein
MSGLMLAPIVVLLAGEPPHALPEHASLARIRQEGSMLSTFEVVINSFVLVLLPLVIVSLMRGSPAPNFGPLSKFYHAEKYLNFAGNLFLLALIAIALGKLGLHFGYIDASRAELVDRVTLVPFMAMFFVFVGLWVKAALKLRRLEKNGA